MARNKRPSDPPWVFKNKPYQDIGIWLMAVQDYFEQHEHLWTVEVDQVKYAMARIEGIDVTPLMEAYRKKISGALGYSKEEGDEL